MLGGISLGYALRTRGEVETDTIMACHKPRRCFKALAIIRDIVPVARGEGMVVSHL